jgi:hypothetical protein
MGKDSLIREITAEGKRNQEMVGDLNTRVEINKGKHPRGKKKGS